MIIHDANANAIESFPTDEEGNKALPVLIQHTGEHIHLDAQNIAATTPFLLISLGDTTHWKHTLKSMIHVDWLAINLNPSSSYRGDVNIGFLSNSSATAADFHILKTYHFDQAANGVQAFLSFLGSHMECSTDHWYGPTVSGDTRFGTTRSMLDPSGYTHFGTYNGDLVMKIGATAGNIDVGVTVGYHTT